LEAYVSRLRRILAPHGLLLERRGSGYALELGSAVLDAARFEELVVEAGEAADRQEHDGVAKLSEEALGLWRAEPLAELSLEGDARIELDRLEELRLRALAQRFGAALALGRQEQVVGELRQLVDEHPYRERFAAQLMTALYRSGRQAEALEVYERTRRRLDDDLGLVPGPELRELSARIVRQEPELLPAQPNGGPSPAPAVESRRRPWRLAGVLAAAGVAVAVALSWAFLAGGSSAADDTTRVALVIPLPLVAGREDTFGTPFVEGLLRAEHDRKVQTETIALTEFTDDPNRPLPSAVGRLARRLRGGDFDLVLLAGSAGFGRRATSSEFQRMTRRSPETRFVFVDACCLRDVGLDGEQNVAAVSFDDRESGYLVGYLAGLVEARETRRGDPVMSTIGGWKGLPPVEALIEGFERGIHETLPKTEVLVDYSNNFVDQDLCARIANSQIDAGSTIVFPAAGTCSLGALRIAGARGVWGIGVDGDRSDLGPHILASTVKRFDRAVELVVQWYEQGTLPKGEDIVLGIDDDAVGIVGLSPKIPAVIREKMGVLAQSLTLDDELSPEAGQADQTAG
jgi:basic membrane lipoprotein Med (substrate-binding protein (PBP1-ABC) superfamily)